MNSDPCLSQFDALVANVVRNAFNSVVYNVCDKITSRGVSPDESPVITPIRFVATVHTVLQVVTKLFGFRMNHQNAADWTVCFSQFILTHFYRDNAFQPCPEGTDFGIDAILESLFQSMAKNFRPNKMDRVLLIAFIMNLNSGEQ